MPPARQTFFRKAGGISPFLNGIQQRLSASIPFHLPFYLTPPSLEVGHAGHSAGNPHLHPSATRASQYGISTMGSTHRCRAHVCGCECYPPRSSPLRRRSACRSSTSRCASRRWEKQWWLACGVTSRVGRLPSRHVTLASPLPPHHSDHELPPQAPTTPPPPLTPAAQPNTNPTRTPQPERPKTKPPTKPQISGTTPAQKAPRQNEKSNSDYNALKQNHKRKIRRDPGFRGVARVAKMEELAMEL